MALPVVNIEEFVKGFPKTGVVCREPGVNTLNIKQGPLVNGARTRGARLQSWAWSAAGYDTPRTKPSDIAARLGTISTSIFVPR